MVGGYNHVCTIRVFNLWVEMKLHPYQVIGAKFLAGKPLALLGDQMGLGKTPQAIEASNLTNSKRNLVVCPAALRSNWENEIKKWDPRDKGVQVLFDESPRPMMQTTAWYVCSYDYTVRRPGILNKTELWDTLILDESQSLKSTDAKRSGAIFGVDGVCRNTKRVWCLSGTPAPKDASELWIMMYSFGVTKLKYNEFVARYCNHYKFKPPYGPERLVVVDTKIQMIPEIKKLLSGFMLRRKVEDVMPDLPPITFSDLVVKAGVASIEEDTSLFMWAKNPTLRQQLDEKLQKEKMLVKSIVENGAANADILLLLQAQAKATATLRRYNGLQKIQPVVELVTQELLSGAYDKIVIFAIHRDVVELLRQKLEEFGPVTVYGGTNPKKVVNKVQRFQSNYKCRVFIGNLQAAGKGLTLTSSNQVLMVETDYVPENITQAPYRCRRIGQTKPVFCRFVTLDDPLDKAITARVRERTEQLSQIFD